MSEHEGLPVHGYNPQSAERVAAVNENKVMEELCLRLLDNLAVGDLADGRGGAAMTTRITETERFVRNILQTWNQHATADDPKLVNQIARKIVRALPVWTHADSPLRRAP